MELYFYPKYFPKLVLLQFAIQNFYFIHRLDLNSKKVDDMHTFPQRRKEFFVSETLCRIPKVSKELPPPLADKWVMLFARHKYISRCIQVVLITSNCFSWLSIFFRRVSHICFKAAQSSLALECHTYPDNFSQTKLRPMKWEKAFFAIANTWRKSKKKTTVVQNQKSIIFDHCVSWSISWKMRSSYW